MGRSLLTKSLPGSDLPGESSVVRLCILAAAAGAGFSVLLFLIPNVEPFWVFLAVICAAVAIIGVIRFPAAFLVPVVFVSSFKDSPHWQFLQSRVDLTLLCLMMLVAVMLFHLLFEWVRPGGWSLWQHFAGQGKGVGLFFLFAGIVIASYLYSPSVNYGWKVASRFCGIGVIFFLAPLILVKREKDFRHFVIAFIFFGMYLAVELVIRLQNLNPEEINPQRDPTTAVTRILEGWKVAMAILMVLYYRFSEKRVPRLLLMLVCVPWLAVGLATSTSRGAALSLVPVVGLTYVLLGLRKKSLTAVAGGLLALVVVVMACGAAYYYWIRHIPVANQLLQEKERELVQQSKRPTEDHSTSLGLRVWYYREALRMLPENPIFGLGVGGWNYYHHGQDTGNIGQHVHNILLEVAVEEGLLGLAVFLALLGAVASALKKVLHATGDRFVVLFALLACILLNSMFSGNLDDIRLLWLLCSLTFAVSRMVDMGLVTTRLTTR